MAASMEETKKEDSTVASINSGNSAPAASSQSKEAKAPFAKGLIVGIFAVAAVVAWMYLYLNNAHLFSQEEFQSLQERNTALLEANDSLANLVGTTSGELNELRLQAAERSYADNKQRLDEAKALVAQIEAAQADLEQAQIDFNASQARLDALKITPAPVEDAE